MLRCVRWRWITLILSCLICLGAVHTLHHHGGVRVTKSVHKRILKGMTREEVFAIVRGPPGDYSTRPIVRAPGKVRLPPADCWLGDDSEIVVRYDERGFVTATYLLDVGGAQRSFLSRLITYISDWLS